MKSDHLIKWDYPNPFTIERCVTKEHIDRLGHTNNAVYVRWIEEVSWAHSEAIGIGIEVFQKLKKTMAVRKHSLEYLGSSYLGDIVQISNWITENNGKLRIQRTYQICRVSDGVTLLRGYTDFVCIDLTTGKPCRMPPEFIKNYTVIPVSG
jgi:acyl-CoA thioester hydrolase